ncbi:hypothetical protein E4U58_006338, partial [Claviceps cyperi]
GFAALCALAFDTCQTKVAYSSYNEGVHSESFEPRSYHHRDPTAAAPPPDVAVNVAVNAAEISHVDPGEDFVEMSRLEPTGVGLSGQDSNMPEKLAYVSE